MKRTRLEDWPKEVQDKIRAMDSKDTTEASKPVQRPKMTKTEAEYQQVWLYGKNARFEAITFHMENGHSYNPDFIVFEEGKPTECHEVKGGYRLHTYQRARLAFDQCKKEFFGLKWVWAEKKNGNWEIN